MVKGAAFKRYGRKRCGNSKWFQKKPGPLGFSRSGSAKLIDTFAPSQSLAPGTSGKARCLSLVGYFSSSFDGALRISAEILKALDDFGIPIYIDLLRLPRSILTGPSREQQVLLSTWAAWPPRKSDGQTDQQSHSVQKPGNARRQRKAEED